MQRRRLVKTTLWDVGLLGSAFIEKESPLERWCHYADCCKYMVNVDQNWRHFQSFVHLCPMGTRCRHLTAHMLGFEASEEAKRHFRGWKHVCPQGK